MEGFGLLLGKNAGAQATGEITDNNAPDPAVGLAQGDEPPEPKCSGSIAGNARLGNQLQHKSKLIGRILVIEEHAGNFSSQSGGGALRARHRLERTSSGRSCAGGAGNPKPRGGRTVGWAGRGLEAPKSRRCRGPAGWRPTLAGQLTAPQDGPGGALVGWSDPIRCRGLRGSSEGGWAIRAPRSSSQRPSWKVIFLTPGFRCNRRRGKRSHNFHACREGKSKGLPYGPASKGRHKLKGKRTFLEHLGLAPSAGRPGPQLGLGRGRGWAGGAARPSRCLDCCRCGRCGGVGWAGRAATLVPAVAAAAVWAGPVTLLRLRPLRVSLLPRACAAAAAGDLRGGFPACCGFTCLWFGPPSVTDLCFVVGLRRMHFQSSTNLTGPVVPGRRCVRHAFAEKLAQETPRTHTLRT